VRTVREMKLVALVALAALAVAGTALAARGDPRERFAPADQTRAQAMLLRQSDFSVAFVSRPPSSSGNDFYCSAIDESDLTLTGKATSPSFTAQTEYVVSTGYVYASRTDSNTSWRRGVSKGGERCLRLGTRTQLQRGSARFVSFKRLAFPPRGDRSVAYRAIATQQGIHLYIDVVAMQIGRAQAAVIYGSALVPPPQSELKRVTATVATRARKAMRGA
jgi:hypothetical protein